jgi:hypothetical protein
MKDKTIIFIIGALLVLGFVYAYDVGGIKTTISKELLTNNNCPISIIPEKVTMVDIVVKTEKSSGKYANSRTYVIPTIINNPRTITSNWRDGERIQVPEYAIFNQYCHKGNSAGENKNNYYCEDLVYNHPFEKVSADGEIIEKGSVEYVISLELKPLGNVKFIESKQVSGSLFSFPEVKIEGDSRKGEDYDIEEGVPYGLYGYKTPYYVDYEVVSSICEKY